MELSLFINSLLENGAVEINPALQAIAPEDISTTIELLQHFHEQDAMEMPEKPPAFDPQAAQWAAEYFFYAVTLTVNREAGEEKLGEYLQDFDGNINVAAIYSADLVLRHLPALFNLAKGLAPADPLLNRLKDTAAKWPFSSVGIELEELKNEEAILSDASLCREYIDRIILKKDRKRAESKSVERYILETTGEYLNDLWPGFNASSSNKDI